MVADRGEPRDQQHRRGLDAVADPRPEQPQPGRRQGAGVEREQPGPRLVEDAQRAPDPDTGARPHRDVALLHPRAEDPDQQRGSAGPATPRPTSAASGQPAASRRPRPRRASRPRAPRGAGPARRSASARAGRVAIEPGERAVRTEPGAVAGRRGRARPRAAGPVGLALGGGTRPVLTGRDHPVDVRPRGDLGVPADDGTRARACTARRRGRGLPTEIGPTCSTSPSIQWPARSTSGSIAAPLPRVSMPVTVGSVCRSTSLPTLLPSSRA